MADQSLYVAETPESVKSAKGLHLLTVSTPNGQKLQIMLEELAARYGTSYTFTLVNMRANEQKSDWFLRINANGRIPTLVDNALSPPLPLHESSAQLVYLQEQYDPAHEFGFADVRERSEMLQWLFFWHGSGAPYMGNAGYFTRAETKSQFAIDRFRNESLRVFGVLEIRLSGKLNGKVIGEPREYLAGNGKGKYSIADIGTWPWVKNYGIGYSEKEMEPFPALKAWVERVRERAAVKVGTGEKFQRPA
jgi:glutathione S-transferase